MVASENRGKDSKGEWGGDLWEWESQDEKVREKSRDERLERECVCMYVSDACLPKIHPELLTSASTDYS